MQPVTTLAGLPAGAVASALVRPGLCLDVGAVVIRVRASAPSFAEALQTVYGAHEVATVPDFADVDVRLRRAGGLRRWLRPQVEFIADGRLDFDPFPVDHGLPMFEWGCNWLIGQRMNHLLLFHAGAVEREGLTLLLPATPGSGKSTLTAALACRGWRLLSDEFGAYDPSRGLFLPLLKPVALKNASIDVIRGFAPEAVLGPRFPKTRKGTVAHLAPAADAVRRRREGARPGAVVLPRWQAGSATQWTPVEPHAAFQSLAFNAFNYAVIGQAGFDATVGLARRCPAWQLVYSDLDDALAAIELAWPAVREHHAKAAPA